MSDVDEAAPLRAARSYLPPFRVLPDFLAPAETARLLDYAAANEDKFRPTKVGVGGNGRINPSFRVSLACRDLGESEPLLERKLRDIAGELVAALKATPFEISWIELQLVAHGDGAFYRRHIDTQTAADVENIRILSGVYYLHRAPKRFSGGALRLYAIGDDTRFVDLEPVHNSLVVFPAWAPHEVMPVSCPDGAFMDSRFAVNCWLHKARTGAERAGDPR
ncbi:MAG TPA: 2OG-Fe(II) oxygenase [Caulobacteraceae bacterium]|nr:2OG-Fe(II) oxygenase [Caulobacteraceae bacterium]